jgi:hypothetical protein
MFFMWIVLVAHHHADITWALLTHLVRDRPGYSGRYSDSLQAGRPGDRIWWEQRFSHPCTPALGLTQPPLQRESDLFPGGKATDEWRWPHARIKRRDKRKSSATPLLPFWAFMARSTVNFTPFNITPEINAHTFNFSFHVKHREKKLIMKNNLACHYLNLCFLT